MNYVIDMGVRIFVIPPKKREMKGKFPHILYWKDVKIRDNQIQSALISSLVNVLSVMFFCLIMFTLFISADIYHDQVVVELSMSYEELQYDIVKEALEDGVGQSKENKKHHHVHKDCPEIK